MENSTLEARLKAIEESLRLNKKVFNTTDLHRYTGLSKSSIYKLTSTGKIPHNSPTGKIIFFDKDEIDSWLLLNKNELQFILLGFLWCFSYRNRFRIYILATYLP